MSNKTEPTVVHRGPGFLSLLALLFIGLKLGHVITWSWLWVLAPLWLGFAIGAALFVIVIVIAAIAGGK